MGAAQLPLLSSASVLSLRERPSRSRSRRAYPDIPSSYLKEMTRLWQIVTQTSSVDHGRAAKAWAEAWQNYVRCNHEDPLRFSLDMASCLEAMWKHKERGVHWLANMTYETVPKMLERFRQGLFQDRTAEALERLLKGER